MQSFREPSQPKLPELAVSLPLPATITISLSTLPLLALITASRLAHHGLTQLGKSSEEIFRGDRLPVRPLLNPENARQNITK